jgi:hypothetical protein
MRPCRGNYDLPGIRPWLGSSLCDQGKAPAVPKVSIRLRSERMRGLSSPSPEYVAIPMGPTYRCAVPNSVTPHRKGQSLVQG